MSADRKTFLRFPRITMERVALALIVCAVITHFVVGDTLPTSWWKSADMAAAGVIPTTP